MTGRDLFSQDEIDKVIEDIGPYWQGDPCEDEYSNATKYLRDRINALPSVTPMQRTGHWIVHPKGIYAHLVCDNCLSRAPYDCKTNYCPTCGAKMVEPQESEEV